jgi:hypothetical protein
MVCCLGDIDEPLIELLVFVIRRICHLDGGGSKLL